jgi:hypothetical protein
MTQQADGADVGDNEEVHVSEAFITNVAHSTVRRIGNELKGCRDINEALGLLARAVIVETVHQLATDGFCACPWHRAPLDLNELHPNGICQFCEHPVESHETVRCCPLERAAPPTVPS